MRAVIDPAAQGKKNKKRERKEYGAKRFHVCPAFSISFFKWCPLIAGCRGGNAACNLGKQIWDTKVFQFKNDSQNYYKNTSFHIITSGNKSDKVITSQALFCTIQNQQIQNRQNP